MRPKVDDCDPLIFSSHLFFTITHPGPQVADLTREHVDTASLSVELAPRLYDPSMLVRENAVLDPFADLVSFKRPTNGVVRGGQAAGGSASARAAAPHISVPALDPTRRADVRSFGNLPHLNEEVADPSWIEGKLDNGTSFWYREDDPDHPKLEKPMSRPALPAARSMYASRSQVSGT